jgi:hypothetical protein
MGESLLITVTSPFALDESIGVTAANLRSPIRAITIHHNDLGTPCETSKAGFDPVLLIETNDNGRNGGRNFLPP